MPVISKSFELQIQVGGGKGSNKVRILANQLVFFLSKQKQEERAVHVPGCRHQHGDLMAFKLKPPTPLTVLKSLK